MSVRDRNMGRLCLTWYFFNVTLWATLTTWYEKESAKFQSIPFIQAVFSGTLSREGYLRFMRQYYHFVRCAGPLYSECAAKLGPDNARIRDWFVKTAFKETGHDEFIVTDLEALGIPSEETRKSHPEPWMDALASYNVAFLHRHHPAGLLGLAFLMGRLSTAYSLKAADKIRHSLGLTEQGATFWFSHGHLDRDQPEDVAPVIQSITDPHIQRDVMLNAKTTFMLYQNFFQALEP